MVISTRMLENLQNILAEQVLEEKDDKTTNEQAVSIIRFVLCKEREAIKKFDNQEDAHD